MAISSTYCPIFDVLLPNTVYPAFTDIYIVLVVERIDDRATPLAFSACANLLRCGVIGELLSGLAFGAMTGLPSSGSINATSP